ncbi:thioredoxin family protein [Chryseobacterium sp.]|uniref:thioredoxin family protein n=1 Tax=Chryseobacterium sp. TaxID=1871047 RepID=UPI0011C93F4E|nr:thioredoxin family protein [Chryseobacterium sp.]TXF79070.1 thioredoxin family protein [Chryseobacterium sp.]
MKRKSLNLFVAGCIFTGFLACSQKTDNKSTETNSTDTVVATKTDSAALLEAKKKRAAEEMAKLEKPYHPEDNAEAKIAEMVTLAKKENKNVMIQAGGNWCIWCLRFNDYVKKTPELKEAVDQNYVYYHLNWSPENKNEAIFKKYGNPGDKFGYPVFMVLDQNGKLIHTQDSAVLEDGKKGYNLQKVKDFFTKWAPKAS